MAPKTVFDAVMMLKNYYTLATLLFNGKNRLPIMIKPWIEYIQNNMCIYQFSHDAIANFMASIIFRIDKATSIYIHSCQEAKNLENINSKSLNMENYKNSVID